MLTSHVIFGVASLTFAVSLALPISVFFYNPELKIDYGDSLFWLYVPPVLSGIAAFISGILSIITHIIHNWFDLWIFMIDLVALITIILISFALPYGIVRLNRILVEKAAEKIYDDSVSKQTNS